MSCSIRQNICKNTVYNDTINCNSNGGIIVRNEINLQDRMLAALRQQSQNTTFFSDERLSNAGNYPWI